MKLPLLVLTLALVAASAGATRITVVDNSLPTLGAGANTVNVQGFTITSDLTDVEVSLWLGAFNAPVTQAFLTTQVGPGTNASHLIAQTALPAVAFQSNTEMLVFQVPSLLAGTYWITVGSGYTWGITHESSVSVGSVTPYQKANFSGANFGFLPASTLTSFPGFSHVVKVTAVPEPALATLLFAGAGLVGFGRRRS